MQVIEAKSGAWNYTIGPAFLWEGTKSIDEIHRLHMPVVVVAEYIQIEDLVRLEMTRILGFVVERKSLADPTNVFFSSQHRAAVLGAAGAVAQAKPGEPVVVDGVLGKAFFDPDEATLAHYNELRKVGPPPEPEGFTAKLMEVSQDLRKAAEESKNLKKDFMDMAPIKSAMDTVIKMHGKEKLGPADVKKLQDAVKGSPVEEKVMKNVERYHEALAQWKEKESASGAAEEKGRPEPSKES